LVGGLVLGSFGNPLIQFVVLMLLFANVRATVLSQGWVAQLVDLIDQEFPERSMETVADRFANRMPAKLWPKCRYVFFPFASILLLLSIVGVVMIKRQAALAATLPERTTNTLEVTPHKSSDS
jgi:hypothetical protein